MKLINEHEKKVSTLAIGDGANDVNMITTASVGVGIMGVEGNQASRASDYSIGEFKMLKTLLFVHGRESYRKNAYTIIYNFYKNLLYLIPQFIMGLYSVFSGLPLYDPYIYQMYNLIYTSAPIVVYGILDKDTNYDKLETEVEYYHRGMKSLNFNTKYIIMTMISGFIQGIQIFYFVFIFYGESFITSEGYQSDVYSLGSIVFFLAILIANLRLFFISGEINFISLFFIVGSIGTYIVTIYLFNDQIGYDIFGTKFIIFNLQGFFFLFVFTNFCIVFDNGISKMYWYLKTKKLESA